MTVSGSTGAASQAFISPIYGSAPCAASAEAQLLGSPEESLASFEAGVAPWLGLAGPFTLQVLGVGAGISAPGRYLVCVYLEASEGEAAEPAQERPIAIASASFTVLPALASAPTGTASVPRGLPRGHHRSLRRCVVPHLRGRQLASAIRAIAGADCALGQIKRIRSRRLRSGRVLWQSRRAGSSLPRGAGVSLAVAVASPAGPRRVRRHPA
jgi:hypothetical protein